MPTATANGITIAFDDRGSGGHTLLLVHGHPFNRSMWSPQLGSVADAGWRVLAPDLRGYGETTVVPGITHLETFAADLAALLDCLGISSVVVGGLSMGGQIAMEFVRQFPDRVEGLLLAATFPQSDTDERKTWRNAMADRLLRDGMEGYATEVLPSMLAARTIEANLAVAQHVLTMMRTSDRAGAAAALRGRAERPSYESTLAGVVAPALIVVGREDVFTSEQDATRMHALLKGSELLWIEGVGHMPNLESPTEFNAGVLRLLERVATSAKKPDLSGEWALDRTASSLSPHASAFVSAHLRIAHDEPRFACSARFATPDDAVEFSFQRFTDGRDGNPSAPGTSRCFWEQDILVSEDRMGEGDGTVVMTWRYDLSSGGRRLRATERIRGGGRDQDNVWEFDRQ